MGSVIPKSIQDQISFFENHVATWNTNATAIGTTTSAVSALTTLTTAARSAFDDQQLAHDVAKSKTLAMHGAVRAMILAGADIIKSVKTKAATAGDGVYTLANIPAPATPGPVGPLGKPSDFIVTLSETGALDLKWKCTNPASASGTIYTIYRRIGTTGEFTFLGGTGEKKFTDTTLPAGSAAVTYQLQAVRSTSVGPWAQFNVNFGVGGGGTMTASVSESTPSRIAA